jgi:hypothetical protein
MRRSNSNSTTRHDEEVQCRSRQKCSLPHTGFWWLPIRFQGPLRLPTAVSLQSLHSSRRRRLHFCHLSPTQTCCSVCSLHALPLPFLETLLFQEPLALATTSRKSPSHEHLHSIPSFSWRKFVSRYHIHTHHLPISPALHRHSSCAHDLGSPPPTDRIRRLSTLSPS